MDADALQIAIYAVVPLQVHRVLGHGRAELCRRSWLLLWSQGEDGMAAQPVPFAHVEPFRGHCLSQTVVGCLFDKKSPGTR